MAIHHITQDAGKYISTAAGTGLISVPEGLQFTHIGSAAHIGSITYTCSTELACRSYAATLTCVVQSLSVEVTCIDANKHARHAGELSCTRHHLLIIMCAGGDG